jgi:hypothetical protein
LDLAWVPEDSPEPVASAFGRDEHIGIGVEDLYRHRVRLPMRIAVRSRELLPLSGAMLQLWYPRVFVQSDAQRMVASDSGVIWAHQLGDLPPGHQFTPVRDVDQVLVPVDSLLVGAFTVDGQDYPEYVEFLRELPVAGDTSQVTMGIGARVTVNGRARPFDILLRVPLWLDSRAWWPPRIPFSQVPATRADSILFDRAFDGSGVTLFGGAFNVPHHERLRFSCVKSEGERLLGYSVGGRPVRVLADTSGSWLVDLDLVRLGVDGPLMRRTYLAARPMDLPGVPTSARPALPGEVALGPAVLHWRLRE